LLHNAEFARLVCLLNGQYYIIQLSVLCVT